MNENLKILGWKLFQWAYVCSFVKETEKPKTLKDFIRVKKGWVLKYGTDPTLDFFELTDSKQVVLDWDSVSILERCIKSTINTGIYHNDYGILKPNY